MKKSVADKLIADSVAKLSSEIALRKGQFAVSEEESEKEITLHKRKSNDGKVIEFQKACDDLFIVSTLLNCKPQETKLFKSFKKFSKDTELAKAMTTTGSGSGAEWIPTDFSADLIDMVQMELRVAALFPRINMPTDPFKIPAKNAFSLARKGTQGSAPTASTVGTSQVTLSTSKLIDYVPVAYELDEDSVVAMLPLIKDDIANSIARAQENTVLNGDTTGTHMDSDTTAADDQRKCWLGLRKLSIANSYTTDVSAKTAETFNNVMTLMGKFGASPSKLAWITGTKGLGVLRVLKDSDGNQVMISMDKIGPRATVLTGMVGSLFGAPVIGSEFIREDLNASGVYDGITDDYSVIHLVRTDGFVFGDRRKLMVETFRDIKSQTIDVVASARMDFQSRFAIASNSVVWTGIKL